MKTDQAGKRKRRIILFYSMGVVIPGIILGYMAFRGILNDEAIREKESRARLESLAKNFFTQLDSTLFIHFENACQSNTYRDNTLAVVQQKTGENPDLIYHKLLYLPDQYLEKLTLNSTTDSSFEQAQSLEFTDQNLTQALVAYQAIAETGKTPEFQIRALLAVARIQKKLNQPEAAIQTYNHLQNYASTQARKHETIQLNKLPVQSTALIEMAKIQSSQKKLDELNKTLTQLLEFALHPPLNYSGSHLHHILNIISELYPDKNSSIDSLVMELNEQNRTTDFINRQLEDPNQIVNSSFRHRLDLNQDVFVTPLYQDDLVAIYDRKNPAETSEFIIVSLFPELKELIEHQYNLAYPKAKIEWGIKGLGNNPKGAIDFSFPDGYPNLKLSLYEDQPVRMASLLAPERGIFILIFVFITLMLIVGLYFTLHTLNQEIRLSRLKSDFIANVSHELKSPLTSIRQRAELLTDNRVKEDQMPAYYSLILEQSEHLSHLIENILDFSRIEDDRKKYRFEDKDINEVIERVIKVFSHLHINSKFSIEFHPVRKIPKVRIDDEAMQQVIFNLVDNAAKFSGKSKKLEIGLQSSVISEQSGDPDLLGSHQENISIHVRDFGLGISKAEQGKIFDRFYRGEAGREMGIKGSGIGLTICNRIVETHGGRLEVESELGKGSTFWIHLPISKAIKS